VTSELLSRCDFGPGPSVDLAVSGGADSLGMLVLAQAAGHHVRVHHVDHHARPTSTDEATYVAELCAARGVTCTIYDVTVEPGPNFEARAREARRSVLPPHAMTAHTMDDLAETMVMNFMRGALHAGLSPMVGSATKPVLALRRDELVAVVRAAGLEPVVDPSNEDQKYLRNRVRHEILPRLNDAAARDLVPILFRQATIADEQERWLDELTAADRTVHLVDADCRILRAWPRARLRLWLRHHLAVNASYPPSFDEVERAIAVVEGEVVATELAGGRRLARRDQRLRLE
jgi:tRNA(Ile)-lysidine synthase